MLALVINCERTGELIATPLEELPAQALLAILYHADACERCKQEIGSERMQDIEVTWAQKVAENPDAELLKMVERGRKKMEQLIKEHQKNTE